MAKVLYITANPKPVDASFSLRLGEHFLEAYRKAHPEDTIERFDVYAEEIPLIDGLVLGAWGKLAGNQPLTEEEQRVIGRMNQILEQFMAADKYVFVTPLWNFGIPPQLKAYIDNLCIAGKTFKYTENGPVGLLQNKKALHIQARGGVYSEGPAAEVEFGDRYLRAVLGFIGITDFHSVIIEGTALDPSKADELLADAKRRAEAAVEWFGTALQRA